MDRWVPIFFNCHAHIRNFFCNMRSPNDASFDHVFKQNECIILSDWNTANAIPWFNSIAKLRCSEVFNPILLLSFQTVDSLLPLIPLSREGVFFHRLPFQPNDLIDKLNSLSLPDVSTLKLEQQQLYFHNIAKFWSELRHGKPNEFLNSVLFPLRMAVSLDANPEEKRKVMDQVLHQNVLVFWNSSLIKSLRDVAEKLDDASDIKLTIHNFFSQLTLLLLELEVNSLINESDLLLKLDKLMLAFKKIDNHLFKNDGTGIHSFY